MTHVLVPQDLGLKIGNVFYSPTSWMLAELGQPSRSNKAELLEKAVENVRTYPQRASEVPLFTEFIGKSKVRLDDFSSAVEELYGIDKLLTEKAVVQRDDGVYASISRQNQIMADVNTRKDARETKRRVHTVSITDPFFFGDQSMAQTSIVGSSEHADFNRLRWSLLNGSKKDDDFMSGLRNLVAKKARAKNLPEQMLKDIVKDLRGRIELADYHAASVLLQLDESLKARQFKDFTGLERYAKASVVMPYYFNGKEEYLFDALLMLGQLKRKKDKSDPPRYYEVSRHFIFRDILSSQSQSMVAKDDARLDALVSQRLFDRQRGVLYAVIEHMYEQFRPRVGFGLEFAGSQFERLGVQFKGLADVYKDPAKRDLTISLVFTNQKYGRGLAFLIYKAPIDEYGMDDLLGKRNPSRLVNPPEVFIDQRKRISPEQAYIEIDPITGIMTRNSIFPVNARLLKRAEEYSKELGFRFNAESEGRKYLPYYRELKPRYKKQLESL